MFFKKRYKYRLKNKDRPYLVHKTCPECETVNDKSVKFCESCGTEFNYKYRSGICLNCGYKGGTKSYGSTGNIFNLILFGPFIWLLFYVSGKVCKRCNRLIRASDYKFK